MSGFFNTINSGTYSGILGGCSNISNHDSTHILGNDITSNRACSTFVNNLNIMNIGTTASGLPSGSIWNNNGLLAIVP